MSSFLIPGEQAARTFQQTHRCTFTIELKRKDPFVLYLRLTPTQTISIINGAPVQLIIGAPRVNPQTISFRLYDIENSSFWINRTFTSDRENLPCEELDPNLPNITSCLIRAREAQIALFDWTMRCLHTEVVPLENSHHLFDAWLRNTRTSSNVYPQTLSEEEKLNIGFPIKFGQLRDKPSFWYMNMPFIEEAGPDPYVLSTNRSSGSISLSQYLSQGKHGYYQENLLAIELYKCFTTHVELFLSPRLTDNTELTDFVVAYRGVVVLIESKATAPYEEGPRKISSVERSLTRNVKKAFQQLLRARDIVTGNPNFIENRTLADYCMHFDHLVCVCIVDDAFMINAHSLAVSLAQISIAFPSPYILELEDLLGILTYAGSKDAIMETFLKLSYSDLPEGQIPLFRLGFE